MSTALIIDWINTNPAIAILIFLFLNYLINRGLYKAITFLFKKIFKKKNTQGDKNSNTGFFNTNQPGPLQQKESGVFDTSSSPDSVKAKTPYDKWLKEEGKK